MSIYVSNLTIYTGTDFEQTLTLEDGANNSALILNNYTGCAQLKRYESSSASGSFNVTFPDRNGGKVAISMGSTTTASLKPGKYFYDLLLNDGESVTRIIEGYAIVKQSVTR
jgi:hypothetical protein